MSGVKRERSGSPGGPSKRRPGGARSDVLESAPRELLITEYAESRLQEMDALHQAVFSPRALGGKQVGQKQPRHMKRRAMSHNIKRLPRSLHSAASINYANQEQTKKRPSRFHRRRPSNLLQEYTRRQRKHIWLETHIWFAKRFHMTEKWGYKLPIKPTGKGERATYRATTKHCMLQDRSYYCCMELVGAQEVLLEGLSHITDSHTGPSFGAVSSLAGTREGHTVVYKQGKYPSNAIGPISFLWKPNTQNGGEGKTESTNQRQLWIWCHPACFDQLWIELSNCFGLEENESDNTVKYADESVSDDSAQGKFIDDKKLASEKNVKTEEKPFICNRYKTDITAQNKENKVTLKSLAGKIVRFRLTGPQSNAVLADALQQANIVPVKESSESAPWWRSYYAESSMALGHVTQREFMEGVRECQSPAELPPRCVVAMTVRDPRLTRPERRTYVEAKNTEVSCDVSTCKQKPTVALSLSPLMDSSIREEVSSTKMPDHQIHNMKSENMVPGTPLDLGDEEARIPVILIQRPGVTAPARGHGLWSGHGAGWDLLLPSNWSMPFWLSLVYRGARCGGLNEEESIAREGQSLLFPQDFPDTEAGREYQLELEKENVDKYNRKPPAKRPNFKKYGVVSPFSCPWKLLVEQVQHVVKQMRNEVKGADSGNSNTGASNVDGNQESEKNVSQNKMETDTPADTTVESSSFYVLRDSKMLRCVNKLCEAASAKRQQSKSFTKPVIPEELNEMEKLHANALVPVRIQMVHKGLPTQFATVCLPDQLDVDNLNNDKNYGGPLEPLQDDPEKREIRALKKKMKETKVKQKLKIDRDMKMIDDKEDVVVNGCSRAVIGYMNSGGFSLGTGGGGGVGLVAVVGLVKLLKEGHNTLVLVRSNSTLQYRFAYLSIVT